MVKHARCARYRRRSDWDAVCDIDFTALATTDYDHTAANVTIGGFTWTQSCGAANLDDLDVNGTGLIPNMGAANSAFDFDAGAGVWCIYLPVATLYPAFATDTQLWFELICGDAGNENTELAGMYYGNDQVATGGALARGMGIACGWSGGAAAVVDYRQNAAAVASANTASANQAIAMRCGVGHAYFYHGVASGTTFPTTWAYCGRRSNNGNGTNDWGVTDIIALWAATGNANNNYAPSFKRLRGFAARNSGQTSDGF